MKKYYRVWFVYLLIFIYGLNIILGLKFYYNFYILINAFLLYFILDNLFKLSGLSIFDYKLNIKPQNKILFYKLKKQYLNNITDEDMHELQIFLDNCLQERKLKK